MELGHFEKFLMNITKNLILQYFLNKSGLAKGIILLLTAEFFFALATVFVKLLSNFSIIPAIEITFFRFLVGSIIGGILLYRNGETFVPNNLKFVLLRAIFNTTAFILFFASVQYTSITNANMLNMTYPIFIFIISIIVSKKLPTIWHFFILFFSITGIYLVIHPNFRNINIGDLLGLASGITGAIAILSLRMARKYDSSLLILFYLMSIGLVINLILMIPFFIMPNMKELIFLLISGILGFAGQAFLTIGYRYISARNGSMISSSRVLFAGILGYSILSESITLQILLGGILIIFSIVGTSCLAKDSDKN